VWRLISSLFSLLPQLWRGLIGKRSTVRYPDEPLMMPPGYRGHLAVMPARCRGCGLCVRDCPAAALDLKREGKRKFLLIYHPNRCAFCGQCELSCHANALRLTNDYVPAAFDCTAFEVTLVDHDNQEEDANTAGE